MDRLAWFHFATLDKLFEIKSIENWMIGYLF